MWILSQFNSPYKNMLTCKYKLGRNTALTGSAPAYLQIYYGSWISRLLGTSLVAQRLRHHTPSAGGPGLVPQLKILHATTRGRNVQRENITHIITWNLNGWVFETLIQKGKLALTQQLQYSDNSYDWRVMGRRSHTGSPVYKKHLIKRRQSG